MQIQVNSDNHTDGSAELARQAEIVIEGALGRFRDRVTHVEVQFRDETSSHKFGHFDKRCIMEARLGGFQPITVSAEGSSVEQALAGAAERLENTLSRTLGRRESLAQRRARAEAELSAAEPVLKQSVVVGKQEDFIELLDPILSYLGDHARRELRMMEINGTLHPGKVTAADLLNEVRTRAWLQFPARPEGMPLDLWLMNQLHEVLDEWTTHEPRMQRTRHDGTDDVLQKDVPQVGDQEWWVWLLGEDETITGENAIIGRPRMSVETQLETEEQGDRVYALLGELPKLQRQAFELNTLDGYELFEIAMLQDRPTEEIKADIEAARKTLRQRLRTGERVPALTQSQTKE